MTISLLTGFNPFQSFLDENITTRYRKAATFAVEVTAEEALELRVYERLILGENAYVSGETTLILPGVPDFILERMVSIDEGVYHPDSTVKTKPDTKHDVHIHPDFQKEIDKPDHKMYKSIKRKHLVKHIETMKSHLEKHGHETLHQATGTHNKPSSVGDHPNKLINDNRAKHRAKNMHHSHVKDPSNNSQAHNTVIHYGHSTDKKTGKRTYHILGQTPHGSMDHDMHTNGINKRSAAIKESVRILQNLL